MRLITTDAAPLYMPTLTNILKTAGSRRDLESMVKFIRDTAATDPIRQRQWAAQDLGDALSSAASTAEIASLLNPIAKALGSRKAQITPKDFRAIVGALERQWKALEELDGGANATS